VADEKHYAFGQNWLKFLETVDDASIQNSRRCLEDLFGVDTFEGKSFLDIGCGSGLSSLAVWRMGVDRLFSFDYDADSVAATKELHRREDRPDTWTIEQGDILDPEYVRELGRFDVVHSWGVLHHTGDMWQAIRNAATLTRPGGTFMIGIYAEKEPMTGWMKTVKRIYAHTNPVVRFLIRWAYVFVTSLYCLLRGKLSFRDVFGYKTRRGMDYWRDLEDWLGGYPYEYAHPDRVIAFVSDLGFEVTNTIVGNSFAVVNQYVFRRLPESANQAEQTAEKRIPTATST